LLLGLNGIQRVFFPPFFSDEKLERKRFFSIILKVLREFGIEHIFSLSYLRDHIKNSPSFSSPSSSFSGPSSLRGGNSRQSANTVTAKNEEDMQKEKILFIECEHSQLFSSYKIISSQIK
jgi:hypothetical protein